MNLTTKFGTMQSFILIDDISISRIHGGHILHTSPYMVVDQGSFTKHYFVEIERFASPIGDGSITPLNTHAISNIYLSRKASKVNAAAPNEIRPNKFTYLRSLTNHMNSHHTTYWQHGDHLGSASWVTDTNGLGYQHLQYTPWGEPFIEQHVSGADYAARYTFSGKERDEETGFSYFGARPYNSLTSTWLSVDPLSDKYPGVSPYVYCNNNPVRLVDPDGREIDGYEGSNGKYVWFDTHSEQSFTDNNNVTWSKVTNNRANWNEATTIRNANIEGLVSLGFDRSQAENDVRLYGGDNPLFTKESKLNNADRYIKSWKGDYNSGGETACVSSEIKNTGYSLKYYPTKNGEKNSLGIVKSGKLGHYFEGGMEWIERKFYSQRADEDPLYDMHYKNACKLINSLKPSNIDIYSPSSIYSNYHKSGGMKLP